MGKDLFTMEGKTVVFTGGCGSLGRVMVKALLEYGAAVAVLGRRDRLDESYEEYRRNGRLSVIPTDLSKSEDSSDIPWNPPTYGAGKAGVLQFTRYCASALARRNIRVNSITPGPFPNISLDTDQEFIRRLSGKTMMNRTGKPEELNGALLLLCSEASSFMTGTNIIVDGGMTQW